MKYKNDFEITTSWLTVSKKNEQSTFHNHNNCMYSGVFYLQTDENSGDIVFENFENAIKDKSVGTVIMEVSRNFPPNDGYLEYIRKRTRELGLVLIFDECSRDRDSL